MINIVKIESINATENCQLNIFSVRIIFLQTELFLIYPILIWSRSRGLDIIWTNIVNNILSIEWKLKIAYQQNFAAGK